MIDLRICFSVVKKNKNNDTSSIGQFLLVKNATGNKLAIANGKKLHLHN